MLESEAKAMRKSYCQSKGKWKTPEVIDHGVFEHMDTMMSYIIMPRYAFSVEKLS
jgi:hypothetical protein